MNINDLARSHPSLIRDLQQFSFYSVARRVSGLLLIPGLHTNTIRLEILLHLAAGFSNGGRTAHRDDVRRWLNQDLSQMAALEDPSEDVFTGNIIGPWGNARVLTGVWEGALQYLQLTYDVFYKAPRTAGQQALLRAIRALLRLSETAHHRSGLERNCIHSGSKARTVAVPSEGELRRMTDALTFEGRDLERLEVDSNDLIPFLSRREHLRENAKSEIGCSPLERRPLYLHQGVVQFVLPTACSTAIRRAILEWARTESLVAEFEYNYAGLLAQDVFANRLDLFDGDLVQDSIIAPKPCALDPIEGQYTFDHGKTAHVIVVPDHIDEVIDKGFASIAESADIDKINARFQEIARLRAAEPEYSGGLSILILGGIGRGWMIGLKDKLPNNWEFIAINYADLTTISEELDIGFLRLWKLEREETKLSDQGVTFGFTNGLINLYAFWKAQGYTLLHDEMPFPGTNYIQIGTDYQISLRRELLHAVDHIGVKSPTGGVSRLSRLHAHPLMGTDRLEPIYANRKAAAAARLQAAIVLRQTVWWVALNNLPKGNWSDLAFRIWEATTHWCLHVAQTFETTNEGFPDLILVDIVFLDPGNWPTPTTENIHELPEGDAVSHVVDGNTIQLTIRAQFLKLLANSKNSAERELVRHIVEGAKGIATSDAQEESVSLLVQQILKNDDARWVHMYSSREGHVREMVPDRVKARLIQPEDQAYQRVGLVPVPAGEANTEARIVTTGTAESRVLLEKLVDDVWSMLKPRIFEFDRHSLIQAILKNVEALHVDRLHWAHTARAQLALRDDKESVLRIAHKHEVERARAAQASRVLAEMAVCESPLNGGRAITTADLDELLSRVSILVELAFVRDSILGGLIEPTVERSASGRLIVDYSRFTDILEPRSMDIFGEQFKSAAATYERLYRSEPKTNQESGGLNPRFVAAFAAEYKVSMEDVVAVGEVILAQCEKTGQAVLVFNEDELKAWGRELVKLAEESVHAVLEHFSLQPRRRWDKTPPGFDDSDWYPWMFRRRLSLTRRPIVSLGNGRYVVTPLAYRRSIETLLRSMIEGHLPAEEYSSEEMKSWLGTAANITGHGFAELVGARFKKAGFQVELEVPVSKIVQIGNGIDYGDIDVLAWDQNTGDVWLCECKAPQLALSIHDVVEQLQEYRGETSTGGKLDKLAKHIRRFELLKKSKALLANYLSLKVVNVFIVMMFDHHVPMRYANSLPIPKESILIPEDIPDRLQKQA